MAEETNGGTEPGAGAEVFSIPEPAQTVRLEPETVVRLHRLADIFERMNLAQYLAFMSSPRRILWFNFVAGLARGLGFAIGMTVLFGLTLYLLGHMVDLPLIGKYIAKIVAVVNEEINPNLDPAGRL